MKFFLFFLLALFVAAGSGVAYVVFYLPVKINGQIASVNLAYFFVSGFVSLASLTSLMLYSASHLLGKRVRLGEAVNRPKQILRKALRRGFLFAAIVFAYLGFRLLGIANPINTVLLLLIAVLAESYLSSR